MQAVQWTHSICVPLRMSMPVGQTATHWWQSMQSPLPAALALLEGLAAAQRAALLAALVVVGDDDGVLVEQRGLEPAVGADERAGLLAEPREDGVEHQREQDHDRQPVQVLAPGRR